MRRILILCTALTLLSACKKEENAPIDCTKIYGKWEKVSEFEAPFQISISKSHIEYFKKDGQVYSCSKIIFKDDLIYLDQDEYLKNEYYLYKYNIEDCKLTLTSRPDDYTLTFYYKKVGPAPAQEPSGSCD